MANSTKDSLRLPIHRGPFYFDPNYVTDPSNWRKSINDLLSKVQISAAYRWTVLDRYGDWSIVFRFEMLELCVDARSGTLSIDEWNDDEDDRIDDRWTGPIGELNSFREALSRAKAPSHVKQEFRTIVLPAAQFIATALLNRFDQALRLGIAAIEAKPNSVLSPFQRVEPDEFRRFYRLHPVRRDSLLEFDDDLDEGLADGVPVFSISVIATGKRVPKAKSAAPEMTRAAAHKRLNRDRRKKYDWDRLVDPIIKEGRKQIPQGLSPTVSRIQQYVEETLDDCPGKTELRKRIGKLFPDL